MKKSGLIIVLIIFTLFSLNTYQVYAHPGRTDANGGHYCRTNCEKWGYEYDEYHYHNSGGSGSSSGSSSSTSTGTPAPAKPSYTQADVDEGTEDGEKAGYEAGYSRSEKRSTSDHSDEGYKIGYSAGYLAGYNAGLEKIKAEDRDAGLAKGKTDGKQGARDGQATPEAKAGRSDDWNAGYQEAYQLAYNNEEQVMEAEQAGYDMGELLLELVVPEKYQADNALSVAFKTFYQTGFDKAFAEEEANYYQSGYDRGYALEDDGMDLADERFNDAFESGYQAGLAAKLAEFFEQGYHDAFLMIDFELPDSILEQKLQESYQAGFMANEIAAEIKNKAFNLGYENKEYVIADTFLVNDDSGSLYDELFYQGQEARQSDRQQQLKVTGIVLIIILVVAGLVSTVLYRKGKLKPISFKKAS
ncbi:hypothetical protein SAMN04488134_1046 [Amphibacillus marinus]|uniref:YHYH domain-containing protein n=1 Tax=Amphibacillus marinus TaxID=872970 RepID=A0A1H8M2Y7_9BACI|nr:hypothetical protein SAMN04488134_1046 [Amphibacillus marinus]